MTDLADERNVAVEQVERGGDREGDGEDDCGRQYGSGAGRADDGGEEDDGVGDRECTEVAGIVR